MSGPAQIFRQVHRLRRYCHDLREQLARFPRQLKAHQTKVEVRETALREAQEALRKGKVAVHDKEVSLKTRHGQIAKYEKQINEVSGKKEYDALQIEIAAAKADCSRLEDEILAGMTDTEEMAARLPELEKAVQQAKGECATFQASVETRKADLQAQLAKGEAELKVVEVDIPRELREQYNRVVKLRDADGFAAVVDSSCSECNCEIPVQSVSELRRDMFMVCRSCGRILYLPEEAFRSAEVDE